MLRRLCPLCSLCSLPVLAFTLWVLGLCAPEARAAEPDWRRLELGAGRYALRFLPASLVTSPPPLIVFLHGSGSSPDAWKDILAPHAEELGAVLLMPRAISALGFGPGDDLGTLQDALAALAQEIPSDPRRRYLAGFSSGGAFALYLAHTSQGEWAATLGLGSPYRIVTTLGDPAYRLPTRLVYGNLDANYTGGHFEAWQEQLTRLGVELETSILPGIGHGSYPAETFHEGFSFLLSKSRPAPPPPGLCTPGPETLCLHEGRFAITLTWRDFLGQSGPGQVAPASSRESGLFYFFSPGNWEIQVKVLDGCGVNGHFWIFTAASTNVAYSLVVEDLLRQQRATYNNPLGQLATTVADIEALATCP